MRIFRALGRNDELRMRIDSCSGIYCCTQVSIVRVLPAKFQQGATRYARVHLTCQDLLEVESLRIWGCLLSSGGCIGFVQGGLTKSVWEFVLSP